MQMIHTGVRSIGEILAILKQEFSDITISKIRFLESQGLIEPKRTASGYRQFNDEDLARLRFILRQQRENFLPLKVIKGRLAEGPLVDDAASTTDGDGVGSQKRINVTTQLDNEGTMSRADLIRSSSLSETQIKELEDYGFLRGQRSSAGTFYGHDALAIAKLAGRFLQFGVEPRHLRSFKTAAEREGQLYKQLVTPVRGQRNTQARNEAMARLEELSNLGASLRDELLRSALADQ